MKAFKSVILHLIHQVEQSKDGKAAPKTFQLRQSKAQLLLIKTQTPPTSTMRCRQTQTPSGDSHWKKTAPRNRETQHTENATASAVSNKKHARGRKQQMLKNRELNDPRG